MVPPVQNCIQLLAMHYSACNLAFYVSHGSADVGLSIFLHVLESDRRTKFVPDKASGSFTTVSGASQTIALNF